VLLGAPVFSLSTENIFEWQCPLDKIGRVCIFQNQKDPFLHNHKIPLLTRALGVVCIPGSWIVGLYKFKRFIKSCSWEKLLKIWQRNYQS
jgi:hypothetical protein